MRERFWSAHRSHVYQQMCDLGVSHLSISVIYTLTAALFAALGIYFESIPSFGQIICFWGAIALSLVVSLFVVIKNSRRTI